MNSTAEGRYPDVKSAVTVSIADGKSENRATRVVTAGGNGTSFTVSLVMIPRVPSEPSSNCARS